MADAIGLRILAVIHQRGRAGATREDLFRAIKGVRYDDLEKSLKGLEKTGCVTIQWLGPKDFVSFLTDKGRSLLGFQLPRTHTSPEEFLMDDETDESTAREMRAKELAVYLDSVTVGEKKEVPSDETTMFKCPSCDSYVGAKDTICRNCGAVFAGAPTEHVGISTEQYNEIIQRLDRLERLLSELKSLLVKRLPDSIQKL